MKKLLVSLLAFLMCVLAPGAALALNEWTTIVYMVNDDDDDAIEQANLRHLNAMVRLGSPAGMEVLVQVDGRKSEGGFLGMGKKNGGGMRYLVQKGTLAEEGNLGEVNMGSPYVLWDCLKWAVQKHPAKRYLLIINSHGSGVFSWRGTGATSSSKPGAVDFDPGRFVAYDDTDNDCLTVFELAAVMKAFKEKLNNGRKCDIVGFDACLPGSVEVLFQLRDSFDYMVGCADTTPITGFDYTGIMQDFGRNPAIDGEKAAAMISQRLNHRYMGAWSCSKAPELTFALNNIAMELVKAMKETGKGFSLPNQQSFGGKNYYWDLAAFAAAFAEGNANLNGAKNAQVLKQYAAELREALTAARLGSQGKLTLAWPASADYQKFRAFYKALDFSSATQWDEVLDIRELNMR